MSFLTPKEISDITGGKYIGDESMRNNRISGVVSDSNDVSAGNLFLCIRGSRVDGHDFATDAINAGAACILAERDIQDTRVPYILVESTLPAIQLIAKHYREKFKIPIIGITGSVGKTTTKEMVSAMLGIKFNVLNTIKNRNNELGVALTLLSLDYSHEIAVIEMGISDFGDMSRLAQMVQPDIFIITEIGYSHLDNLGDLNGVLRAKTETFDFMKPDGIAIINGDNELLSNFDPGIRKITFGFGKQNEFYTENINPVCVESVKCDIINNNNRLSLAVPAYGIQIVMAALAATAVGRLFELNDDDIVCGIESYTPVDGRANIINTGFITLIDDCYNANPNSVRAAVQSLSELQMRRVAILGDMLGLGKQADELHREAGEFIAKHSIDILLCCGEKAFYMYDSFRSVSKTDALYFPDKKSLMEALPELIKKDDVVLVKASNAMQFEEILESLKNM